MFPFTKLTPARVLFFEGMGTLSLVLVIWVNELFDLPHRWLGAPPIETGLRVEEAVVESGIALLVGGAVMALSTKLLQRISYLESFVRICAWCRRVRVDEKGWMPVEAFLVHRGSSTTHGICDTCADAMDGDGRAA